MHRDMGLNLIRVWGGGIAERPEFYDAADEMGVLVMQEFWMTVRDRIDDPLPAAPALTFLVPALYLVHLCSPLPVTSLPICAPSLCWLS